MTAIEPVSVIPPRKVVTKAQRVRVFDASMLHHNARDFTGIRSGKLVAVAATDERIRNQIGWLCKCDCGVDCIIPGGDLRAGRFRDCGSPDHDLSKISGYSSHRAMMDRCHNELSKDYVRYGARGILVCDRWRFGEGRKSGVQCFLEDMGARPTKGHSVDRIEINGGYSPSNCRWATVVEQSRNRANNYFQRDVDPREVCRNAGVKYGTFRARVAKGYSIEAALIGIDGRSGRRFNG